MLYLKEFTFASIDSEEQFINYIKQTIYSGYYPFGVLGYKSVYGDDPAGGTDYRQPQPFRFEPVTVFYGGNGSGKTTVLNVIAEKLGAERDSLYNRTNFFEDYLKLCRYETGKRPACTRIITSDDVFDFMLNLRGLNSGIDRKREELFEDYLNAKYRNVRMESLADFEELKKTAEARRRTQSRFIRENLMGNAAEHSNGETAFLYFTQKIRNNGLYLLDEPENSLSPARQQELAEYLENSVRFFGCQIIMATHSPFLLSLRGARIYDLDESPARVKPWTELPNVRAYYDFFSEHKNEFPSPGE